MVFFLWFLLFWLHSGLGSTLGYHRLAAHKSAKCNRILYYWLLLGGYVAFQGPVIPWAGLHRFHHQVADKPEDWHSPITKPFLYAFNFWIWDKNKPSYDHLVPWLMEDKILRFFGTGPLPAKAGLNVTVCILWRVLVYLLFGLEAATASTLAGIAIFFAPQMINTFCHIPFLGYRNYNTKDYSTNIPVLNILTFGEAHHNNHHAFPSRPFQGEIKRGEIDTTYFFMLVFKKLRLMNF